jgi:hypothetical protein
METAKADEIAGLTVPWIGGWHRCKKLDGYCIGKLARSIYRGKRRWRWGEAQEAKS